jgi:HEAT repeat protein
VDSGVVGSPEIAALIRSARHDYVGSEEAFDKAGWLSFLADAETLRDHGSTAVAAVTRLFSAGGMRDRVVAAELLGRMSFDADPAMRDQCWSQLEGMLSAERAGCDEPAVIAAIAAAFQHLEDVRALPSLLGLAAHPCGEVRLAVACSVPSVCRWSAREEAVAVLVRLAGDEVADVRDWSCFGLGQLDADGPQVRAALAARLDDEDADTRCEALVALARTGDTRAYRKLAERLGADGQWKLEIEAAAEIADTRLHPVLQRLAGEWKDDDDFELFRGPLERAIARCDPRRRPAAKASEARLLADLGGQFASSGRTVHLVGEFPRTRLIVFDADSRSEMMNARIWEYADPLDFNFEQQFGSYLRVLGTPQ